MTWLRVDDRFPDHPKVVGLDPAAIGVWTLCGCYASSRGDDFVPAALPERYAPGKGREIADALVTAGLWEPADGGWSIHDKADYGPPRDLSEKRAAAGRKGMAKRWGTDNNAITNVMDPETNGSQTDNSGTPVPEPVPLRGNGSPDGEPILSSKTGKARKTPVNHAAWFTITWNENCTPLPRLLKPPTRPDDVRLIESAWELFDGNSEAMARGIRAAARDPKYREERTWGFKTFCRNAASRWATAPEPGEAPPLVMLPSDDDGDNAYLARISGASHASQ